MSRAAVSMMAFAVYLAVLGVGLLAAPDLLLALFGQPPTTEPWLRVVGLLVLVVCLYYVRAARSELTPFFRYTLLGRPLASVGLIALVAAGEAPRFVLLMALVDAGGALWTWWALRETGQRG